MKKILLLGGSAQQVVAIEKAKKIGFFTILCDFLPDNPGQYVADKFYLESTTNVERVLEIARQEKIDGIIAYASDPAAPTAAFIAEKMGLPTNPYESVKILCNKDLFRVFLRDHGFHVPNLAVFDSVDVALSLANKFSYPIIIKPVDSSGSKGVTVLHDSENIKEAIEFAFSFSRCKRIIVESFIEKNHDYLIGGDIFILNGEIIIWGLMDCHRDNSVNKLVPVGKSYPASLNETQLRNIKITLQRLVAELNIQNGSMNIEAIIDKNNKCYIIDAGPRAGGNMIPELIGSIFNVDIVDLNVKLAMGNMIKLCPKQNDGFFVTYNLHVSENGIYKGIYFDERIRDNIKNIFCYKKEGDSVFFFDNASKALGIVFLKFESRDEVEHFFSNANSLIKIIIE